MLKKFLMGLGAIFAVLLIAAIVLVIHGTADDKQSRAYADAAVKAIASNWNEQALFDRVSPDFIKATTRAEVDSLFARLRTLGRMTRYGGAKGESFTNFDLLARKATTTAVYIASAQFEHGAAQIRITLVKRDAAWRILGFFVHGQPSPEGSARLLPPTPGPSTAVALHASPATFARTGIPA